MLQEGANQGYVWGHLGGLFRREPMADDENFNGTVLNSMDQIRVDKPLVRSFLEHPDVAYVTSALTC